MLKQNIGFVFALLLLVITKGFSQENLLNAKTPAQIGVKNNAQIQADNDKPLAYDYVDDRDIMWSTVTWEIIDLNERVNFPLLFPIEQMSTNRKSLYEVLVNGIKEGKITEVYSDSYFTEKRAFDDIKGSLSKIDTLDAGYELINAGQTLPPEYIVKTDISPSDILQYRIKGVWYFDKRQGELKYRLLGIAPVAPDVSAVGTENAKNALVELFWVWFPSAREVLHRAKVFTPKNSVKPISFDHLLNSRRFSSVIYKEDNIYGDRPIEKYLPDNALQQLLESNRIKERIRDKEQDMWAY